MTIHTQQQQVENSYIDSLLHLTSPPVINGDPVTNEKTTSAVHNSEIVDDNLYQIVSVDGLKLAISLSEITMVVDDNNSSNSNVFIHNNEPLAVVSLSALISNNTVLSEGDKQKQLILVQHRKLAIECQKIHGIETIEKNLVCWRNENSQRKWLAGTVKQLGVAIIDLTMLQQLSLGASPRKVGE